MKGWLTFALTIAVNYAVFRLARRVGRIEGFRRGYEEGCKDAFALVTKAFADRWNDVRKTIIKDN